MKKDKEPPKVKVYSVLICYDGGMERMDVTAKDRLDVFGHTAMLVRLKQENLGVHRAIKSITIERE